MIEGWRVENGIHWEISVSTLRHSQMARDLCNTTLACEVTPSRYSVSANGRRHISSHRCCSQNVWNEMAPSLKALVESLGCLYWCCVCGGGVLFINPCVLLLIPSFQTLESTPVWLPAPVVKHHGALSWKSKVEDGAIILCSETTGCSSVNYASLHPFRIRCSPGPKEPWWKWAARPTL